MQSGLRTGIGLILLSTDWNEFMKNIVLIGMPGTGKSTVGKTLAKELHYDFVDVDDLIVEATGKTLPQILRTDGLEKFLKIEEEIGEQLNRDSTVIATGGSMVLYESAMAHLRKNGVVVWLETPLSAISDRMPDDLTDRGIAAQPGMTIRQIYEQREPLYAKHADLIEASGPNEQETALQVLQMIRTVGISLI